MEFAKRIVPPLTRLSHKLIDAGEFGYLENIANFLVALSSGNWQRLPTDEQVFWLERVAGLLGARALGDSWGLGDPDLQAVSQLLHAEIKALKRHG